MRFIDAVEHARRAFADAGYPDARIEVHLDDALDVAAVSHELGVIARVIDTALHPDESVPTRAGSRLFATIDDVRVFVRES